MASGDIKVLEQSSITGRGSRKYAVDAGATAIYAGEPVVRALGGTCVTAMATNSPQVGTHYVVGIAQTDSTQTTTASGVVEVLPVTSDTTYIMKPKVAATFDTQAEYDALVGDRVLIDLTTGSYTILAADAAGNGCVIMPLDVAKYPGRVAFAFRKSTSDLD